jgi:hypothetical protein
MFGRAYDTLKAELVRDERLQLREFGFACHVEHAHPFVLSYAQLLELGPEVAQAGWGHVNDCCRTTLVVRYRAHVLACGALFLAARNAGIALPEGGGDGAAAQPPWWALFDARTEEVHAVARVLTCLYSQPRAAYVAVTVAEKTQAHAVNGFPQQQQQQPRQIAVPLPHGGAIGVSQQQQQQQHQQQAERRSRFDAPGGAEPHAGRERRERRPSRSRSRSRDARRRDSRERQRRRHSRSRSRERRRSRSRDGHRR